MKLFFVRNTVSGLYIQQTKTSTGRGSTLIEPGPEASARPFLTYRAALNFLGQWLKGEVEYDEAANVNIYNPVPGRRASDFEIIEKEIDLAETVRPAAPPVPPQHAAHRR